MTSQLPTTAILTLLVGLAGSNFAQEPKATIDWTFTRLDEIAGHKTTLVGSPRVIDTPASKAVAFDGDSAIFLDTNPLAGLSQFTAEVIFQPAASGGKEQRFVHFQEAGSDNRLLFELRLIEGNRWYLDTFIKSGFGNYTQLAEKFPHPVGPVVSRGRGDGWLNHAPFRKRLGGNGNARHLCTPKAGPDFDWCANQQSLLVHRRRQPHPGDAKSLES